MLTFFGLLRKGKLFFDYKISQQREKETDKEKADEKKGEELPPVLVKMLKVEEPDPAI